MCVSFCLPLWAYLRLFINSSPGSSDITSSLTCWQGAALGFILERAELLQIVEVETRRAAIQVRETIDALSHEKRERDRERVSEWVREIVRIAVGRKLWARLCWTESVGSKCLTFAPQQLAQFEWAIEWKREGGGGCNLPDRNGDRSLGQHSCHLQCARGRWTLPSPWFGLQTNVGNTRD